MGMSVIIDVDKMKLSDKEILETSDFSRAFRHYMDESHISANKLSRITGISDKTILRYRNGGNKEHYDLKCLVALCIGLHLYIKRSLHLIHLAGLSLKPTVEQELYYDFLTYTYCSDLTVEKCNDILVKYGYKPLVIKKTAQST